MTRYFHAIVNKYLIIMVTGYLIIISFKISSYSEYQSVKKLVLFFMLCNVVFVPFDKSKGQKSLPVKDCKFRPMLCTYGN